MYSPNQGGENPWESLGEPLHGPASSPTTDYSCADAGRAGKLRTDLGRFRHGSKYEHGARTGAPGGLERHI